MKKRPEQRTCRKRSSSLTSLASGRLMGLLIFATMIASCMQESKSTGALPTAKALLDAFNHHNPEAMAALVSADFELYYVDEAGAVSLSVRGREKLVEEMTAYFASHPSVHSTIVDAVDGPVYVSFREQIDGGQSSLAVYEVRDQLIESVWYFPAE